MAIKLDYNEQYKNYSLDMKALAPAGDWIEFSLKFDEPKTGISPKFNNEWCLFNVILHASSNGQEGDKDVSFFAKGESPEEFKKLGDFLKCFKKGDRFKLTHSLKNFGKMWGSKWEGGLVDGTETVSSPPVQTSAEPQPTPKPSTPINIEETVEKLKADSGGVQQELGWIGTKLKSLNLSPSPQEILEIVKSYNAKW